MNFLPTSAAVYLRGKYLICITLVTFKSNHCHYMVFVCNLYSLALTLQFLTPVFFLSLHSVLTSLVFYIFSLPFISVLQFDSPPSLCITPSLGHIAELLSDVIMRWLAAFSSVGMLDHRFSRFLFSLLSCHLIIFTLFMFLSGSPSFAAIVAY